MAEFSSKRHRLAREIECELDQLARVADIARRLSALSEAERRPWDAAAASKYVADLFLGFENLCKRRNRGLESDSEKKVDMCNVVHRRKAKARSARKRQKRLEERLRQKSIDLGKGVEESSDGE
jgi:hypothetical protein